MNLTMTFQRVEKKYRLTPEQCEEFLARAGDRLKLDEYGLHTIQNVYYDTDDYRLIRESIDKPVYKEKLRLRGYGNISEGSRVFLEIKKKYKGTVYKRREVLPYGTAMEFLESGEIPEGYDSQIMRELRYFMKYYNTKPKLYLAYDRRAYQGTEDPELRLTIDQNIRYSFKDIQLVGEKQAKELDEDLRLMEIKAVGAYPMWLTEILGEMKIYPSSFSKYGTIYKEEREHVF